MSDLLYRIEEESTSGWTTIDPAAVKLNKEQAMTMLNQYIAEGYNPNHLRIRVDNDWFPPQTTKGL